MDFEGDLINFPIIFGGTFSPPHIGHIHIIKLCLEKFTNRDIVIIPSFHTYFKKFENILPYEIRVVLLHKMLEDIRDEYGNDIADRIIISDIEREYSRQLSTSELICELCKKYNISKDSCKFTFLAGDDILLNIDKWINVDYIKKHLEFLIYSRMNNTNDTNSIKQLVKKRISEGFNIIYFDEKICPISSTIVNVNFDENKKFLSKRVAEYMEKF